MVLRYLVRVSALACAACFVLALSVSSDWRAEAAPRGLEWRSWSEEVLSEATRRGRLVLVSGASKACPWCRRMDDQTFPDDELQRLIAASFIPVRVNLRNRDEIPVRFQSLVPPTIVVLNGEGSEVFTHRGYLSAQELSNALNGVVSATGSAKEDRAGKFSIPRFRDDDSLAAFNLQLALARHGDGAARQRISQRVQAARVLANSAETRRGVHASRQLSVSVLMGIARQLVEGGDALRQPEDVKVGAKIVQTLMAEALEQRSTCGHEDRLSRCLWSAVDARLMGLGASLFGKTREKGFLERAETLQGDLVQDSKGEKGGSGLEDWLSLVQGLLDIYSVTAERSVLEQASHVMGKALHRFKRSINSSSPEERSAFVRVGNLLSRYSGDTDLQDKVKVVAKMLATQVKNGSADPREVEALIYFQSEPIHIVVVGPKSDDAARALWDEATHLMYPYLRREWWDREEGPLPNPDVTYPKLPRPAAFLCAHKQCSLPLFTQNELREKIREAVPLL